jgi:membrane protease YdiL (CAAX protease family)
MPTDEPRIEDAPLGARPPDDLPAPLVATASTAGPPPLTRARAVFEAALCTSYPTQIVAAGGLALAGLGPSSADDTLDPTFLIAVSALDAMLVLALVVAFLWRRGESLRDLCLGTAPVWREASLGVAMVVPITLGVAALVLGLRAQWPSLNNVPVNPLAAIMADPQLVVVFALVAVFAGGVREEIQRAFQLHRLSPGVMPPWIAVLVTSVAFGLGHTVQGYDVAVATFALGAFWGGLWLRRRSVVAAAVCHALFNLGQVVAGWVAGRAAVDVVQAASRLMA